MLTNYDPENSWEYNLIQAVRWQKPEEAKSDAVHFVRQHLPNILREDPELAGDFVTEAPPLRVAELEAQVQRLTAETWRWSDAEKALKEENRQLGLEIGRLEREKLAPQKMYYDYAAMQRLRLQEPIIQAAYEEILRDPRLSGIGINDWDLHQELYLSFAAQHQAAYLALFTLSFRPLR